MRSKFLIGCAAVMLAGYARAEPLSLRPFVAAEVFLPTNAGKGLENDAMAGANQLNGIGYATRTTVETRAALGIRVGLKGKVSDAFDLGFSGGYITGPDSDVTITASGGSFSAVVTDKRDVNFVRFLVEPAFNAPINESTAFHLGVGLGGARGSVKESFTCVGNACAISSRSYSSSWTGFTWEISPYFTMSRAMFGLRYAAFPKFKGNSENSKIDWSTLGIFAGIAF